MDGRNDTTFLYDFIPVTEMFERETVRHPERTAVVTSSASMTYSQLNKAANRISHALKRYGEGAEDPILILLPRAIEVYPAIFGILKSGAAFVVANTSYPDDRIRFMAEDSLSRFVISSREVMAGRDELKNVLGKKVLYLDELLACEDDTDLKLPVKEEQLCYCIYTSGSTGRPKGVMLEHGNLTNFVYPAPTNREALGLLEHGSVMLAMAPLTFDVSIMEEFLALTSGMTLAQAGDDEIRDPSAMKHFLLNFGVDAACMTPAYLNTLVSISDLAEVIRQLKVVDLGAEAFPGALYTRLTAINPDLYIMNGYGPTEATISCTMKVITSPEHITIGYPNANVYAYIIDENGNEVPDGEEGELLICGKGVGRGYINLPEKTAEAFISFRGMRGYRTGDRALIDARGEIEFHGRRDNQVKLRGLRIELGEVEEVIRRHPSVREAAALAIDNRYLVLYYTLRSAVEEEELRDFAREYLAHYMVPDIFMELEEMPLTANQKIDRKALPRPSFEAREAVPPENDRQRKLLSLLRQVITDLPESIDENIMDHGVSSLDAMLLMARLEEAFGVSFRIADIFDHPTVRQMEDFILHAPVKGSEDETGPVPINAAQRRRWEIFLKDPEACGWTMALLLKLDPSVSDDALKTAVSKAVSVHPVLLCTIVEEQDQVFMRPAGNGENYIPDVISLSEEEVENIRLQAQPVFDLRSGPLFRAVIYKTEAALYLHLTADHMILDGDSVDILTEDINSALLGQELKPERMSFFTLCREEAAAGESESAGRWYRELLAGRDKVCGLKSGGPDPAGTNMVFSALTCSKEKVDALCSRLHISLTALFTGLLGLALNEENAADQAVFGLSFNGRSDTRLERTVGYLVQNIPICCRTEPSLSPSDYLRGIQEQLLRSMSYASWAPSAVRQWMPACTRHLAICQREEADTLILGGRPAQSLDISTGHKAAAPKDLDTIFTLNPLPWGIMLSAMYDPSLYSEEAVTAVCRRFDGILTSLEKS